MSANNRLTPSIRALDAMIGKAIVEINRLDALAKAQAQMIEERDREIKDFREANEAFARREHWWNDRMFDLEQELERLRAQRDELLAAAQTIASELEPSGDSYNLVARDYFDARKAVARLQAAIAKATQGIHPPKAAPVNLCTYGYEIKSCTSEPMDCQCLLDSLNEEGPLQRLAKKKI